jgi:hypothetical protein
MSNIGYINYFNVKVAGARGKMHLIDTSQSVLSIPNLDKLTKS